MQHHLQLPNAPDAPLVAPAKSRGDCFRAAADQRRPRETVKQKFLLRGWRHSAAAGLTPTSIELLVQLLDGAWWDGRWLGGSRVEVKSRSPASCRLPTTVRCLSRHLRMKALRRVSILSRDAA